MIELNTINKEDYIYSEYKFLDEQLRELQNETLNENWGYWHFSLLDLDEAESLEGRIIKTLSQIPAYMNPYFIKESGDKYYLQARDLKNFKLINITDLKSEIISKADYYSTFSGPIPGKLTINEKYNDLKYYVSNNICDFLIKKNILQIKLVDGIDTFYTFGGDHMGDDIIVETEFGIYVIHFGFSS